MFHSSSLREPSLSAGPLVGAIRLVVDRTIRLLPRKTILKVFLAHVRAAASSGRIVWPPRLRLRHRDLAQLPGRVGPKAPLTKTALFMYQIAVWRVFAL